jgi:cell division protein FtsL
VVLLAAITFYYARHAKRQADANREQVAASNRQADIAHDTLAILREQVEQQRRADIDTVTLQIEVGVQMIDEWRDRIASASYPALPEDVEILSEDFSFAIQSAARSAAAGVAGYMSAAKHFTRKAEPDIRLIRSQARSWVGLRDRAAYNLNVARFKLDQARQLAGPPKVNREKLEADVGAP